MKRIARSPFTWVAAALVVVLVAVLALRGGPSRRAIPTGTYEHLLSSGRVASATIHDGADQITGTLTSGEAYIVSFPDRATPDITARVAAAVPDFQTARPHANPWLDALVNGLPVLVVIGLLIFLMTSMQGGGSRVLQFGKARTKTVSKDQAKVTFADVAGADEAVAELQEIKEFLESPARFKALGARIPKGVLLFGPPGTGKTLLARAVAGEAGVPFFSISGSDFVEMFVGVGASRVRDLFEQAKANSPAIVFVDEIDAVGRHRGAGLGGGHDEREQTLNQLLVEMDGFDARGGVILIAATNRPDILDPALLRPGRFDRQIVVDRPDLGGRRRILEVHAQGKPLHSAVSLDVLAKRTPGFTGADLSNLLNEAAILTARRNLRQIGMRECEEAIDRVMAGPERKTLVMSDEDKLVTAYHEAGHVIVGHVLPHADPIHKVSIVARSRSLGLTYTLPEDRYNHSRSQLRDAMAMCMGGRTAEELAFGEPTTGAENDIEKATRIARAMVTEYGMSDVLGPQQLVQPAGEVFLGRDIGHQANYSQDVAGTVDAEVRALIDDAHNRARSILTAHRATLDRLASDLVERETLDTVDLMAVIGSLAPWGVAPSGAPAGPAQKPGRRPRRSPLQAPTPRPAAPAAVAQGVVARSAEAAGGPATEPASTPRPVRRPKPQVTEKVEKPAKSRGRADGERRASAARSGGKGRVPDAPPPSKTAGGRRPPTAVAGQQPATTPRATTQRARTSGRPGTTER